MTPQELKQAPLLDQVLYDTTGLLVENRPDIAEAMEKYHQAKLKSLDASNILGNDGETENAQLETLLKSLKTLLSIDYSQNDLLNAGYRAAILDSIDLVKNAIKL